MSSCENCEILRTPFFNNNSRGWLTQRNQTTAYYILIEQLLSLNDLLQIVLAVPPNEQVITFLLSMPKIKKRQN